MKNFQIAMAAIATIASLTVCAQFMDPERSVNEETTTMTTVDDLFPEIVPDHGSGDTVIIEKEIGVISNTVEKTVEQVVVISNTVEKIEKQTVVLSNTVEKVVEQVGAISNDVVEVKTTSLKSDRDALTNNMEFVSSVRSIADAGTYPIEEFNQMKVDIERYRVAFSNLSTIVISEESSIDELKRAILNIKVAASNVYNSVSN